MNEAVKNIFVDSVKGFANSIKIGNFEILVDFSPDHQNLQFSVIMFTEKEENFRYLFDQASINVHLEEGIPKAKLCVDEANQRLLLKHTEPLDQVSYARFTELLDELAWLANEYACFVGRKPLHSPTFVYISRNS